MRSFRAFLVALVVMLGFSAVVAQGAASLALGGQTAKTKSKATSAQNKIKLIVDPIGVGEFQIDVKFDPASLEFVGFEILGDYKFESIDLSKLDLGIVADVKGIYDKGGIPFNVDSPATYPPLIEGVQIFEITFKTKAGAPIRQTFTVSPSDTQEPLTHNDFLTIVGDGGPRTIPLDPETVTIDLPEPFGAVSMLTVGMLALFRRRR